MVARLYTCTLLLLGLHRCIDLTLGFMYKKRLCINLVLYEFFTINKFRLPRDNYSQRLLEALGNSPTLISFF